jgi:hypothetical protein
MSRAPDRQTDGEDPRRPLAQDRPRRAQDFGLDMRRLKRIRVITFAILALPLLALALLAGKFVSMPVTQAWHGAAYSDQQFSQAIERLAPVWVVNRFEPYLPHLTKGTDLLQDGENSAAEKELRTALQTWESGHDLNQPMHAQCKIRNNLAISIERQAKDITDDGDRADRMFEAEQIITPCMSGGGGGDGEGQGQGGGDDGDGEGQGGGDGEGQGGGGQGDKSGDPDQGGGGDESGEPSEGEDGGESGEPSEGEGTGNEDQDTTDDNGKRIEDERRDADKKAGNDPDEREKEQKGQDQGDGGQGGEEDGNGGPKDPGDPKREDPEGSEKPEEAPTEGDSKEEQKKKDELDKRNKDANKGEGEDDSDGGDDNPAKPW